MSQTRGCELLVGSFVRRSPESVQEELSESFEPKCVAQEQSDSLAIAFAEFDRELAQSETAAASALASFGK